MFLKRINKTIQFIGEATNVQVFSMNLHIVEALHESSADMRRHAVDLNQ